MKTELTSKCKNQFENRMMIIDFFSHLFFRR